MCIIIVKPQGAEMPPFEMIHSCAQRNPDGFGFAVPGRVFKSIDFDEFYEHLSSEVDEDTPAIIHCRLATHGRPCRSNCHPFRDEASGVSFMHNGILPIEPYYGKTDSETAFSKFIVPEIRKFGFDSPEMNKAVESVIYSSRFAFLSDSGKIKVFGEFWPYAGCFMSNTNFKPW